MREIENTKMPKRDYTKTYKISVSKFRCDLFIALSLTASIVFGIFIWFNYDSFIRGIVYAAMTIIFLHGPFYINYMKDFHEDIEEDAGWIKLKEIKKVHLHAFLNNLTGLTLLSIATLKASLGFQNLFLVIFISWALFFQRKLYNWDRDEK